MSDTQENPSSNSEANRAALRASKVKHFKRNLLLVRLSLISLVAQFWVWAIFGLSIPVGVAWAATSALALAISLIALRPYVDDLEKWKAVKL